MDRTPSNLFGTLQVPLGLGLLRLTTEDRPTEEAAIEIIHQALDAGIRILDTADSYCLNDKDFHYGERLAEKSLATWNGPREEVFVLTKVGMVRPKGRWVPEGSRKHILQSVEASLNALQTDTLFLLQLHVRDPRVPFEETLETLADLLKGGKVKQIGLCNVDLAEVEQASRHFQVASVQNELSVVARSSAVDGMVEWTRRKQIPFLAYRPLGGYAKVDKIHTNRTLKPLSTKLGIPAPHLALAALLEVAPHVVPLFGARKLQSLSDSLEATRLDLDADTKEILSSKLSFEPSTEALEALQPRPSKDQLPPLTSDATPGDAPEVVLLIGMQGAGKSSLVRAYVDRGYERLNRDLQGGKLDDLTAKLEELLEEGNQRFVLDNTYPTMSSRWSVIAKAHRYGIPVRCRYLATPINEAMINVSLRMLDRYQRLLSPEEMKDFAKSDPNLPPPVALQRWVESFEPPTLEEGFSAVDQIPFVRRSDPRLVRKGLLLDVDGTLRRTKSGELYPRSADDVELLPNRTEVLNRWIAAGYDLFLVSNQSGISSGKLTDQDAQNAFARTTELLGCCVKEVVYCPHSAFPAGCFCRKPLPGLGVYLMQKHLLDPKAWVMVGDMESDAQFARTIGARYFEAEIFFGGMGVSPEDLSE